MPDPQQTATCWGWDDYGQLGNDDALASKPTPVAVALPAGRTAVAIAAATYHSCAILDDGSAACWGDDAFGQLGDDAALGDRATPVAVALPPGRRATAISASYAHTCAILDDGTIACWGFNGDGRLGDGSTTNRATPVSAT